MIPVECKNGPDRRNPGDLPALWRDFSNPDRYFAAGTKINRRLRGLLPSGGVDDPLSPGAIVDVIVAV
jgi:hypothetical protein